MHRVTIFYSYSNQMLNLKLSIPLIFLPLSLTSFSPNSSCNRTFTNLISLHLNHILGWIKPRVHVTVRYQLFPFLHLIIPLSTFYFLYSIFPFYFPSSFPILTLASQSTSVFDEEAKGGKSLGTTITYEIFSSNQNVSHEKPSWMDQLRPLTFPFGYG